MSNVLAETDLWRPEDKARALAAVKARTGKEHRVWYCASPGRLCDGAPHEGYPYNHARSDQWPPPGIDWFTWALIGGRGSGKTRSGAEFIRLMSKRVGRIALVGQTTSAVRDTMIEGESGLMACFAAAGEEIQWEPSKRRITFPSGSVATAFSAEEPNRLRGPQHGLAWLDEPAHYPLIDEVWDQMLFGLRLGEHPRVLLTTTPLPTKWMKARLKEPLTRASRVSTYANLSNLAPTFKQTILDRYEGTRLGRQELEGEILEDVEGALWQDALIQRSDDVNVFDRIVVAIDPAGTNNRRSDETGIVAAGKVGKFGYVLEDRSGKYSPAGWANAAITLYEELGADAIVVEKNYGGDMVKQTIDSIAKDRHLTIRVIVTTATRSKALRAEPIVSLYEQHRIFHIKKLTSLEEEMLTWVPGEGDSPNRIDALVWALTELIKLGGKASMASATGRTLTEVRQDIATGAAPTRSRLALPAGFARRLR